MFDLGIISYSTIVPIVPTYSTWNPADKGSVVVLSGGNLVASIVGGAIVRSTVSKSSGKWYWEVRCDVDDYPHVTIGIAYPTADLNNFCGSGADSWGIYDSGLASGYINNFAANGTGYLDFGNGDTIGFLLDMDAGTLNATKNNTPMGSGISGLTGSVFACTSNSDFNDSQATANFGASPFLGTVPVGYNAGLF